MRKFSKVTLALLLLVVTMRFANADRYFIRTFKQTNVQVLNRPSDDLTSEFAKDITIEEFARLYALIGKPAFQTAQTDKGVICYFYVNAKEGYYGRVSYLKE